MPTTLRMLKRGLVVCWALWFTLVLVSDELFVAYETGVEGSHMRTFTAELASLFAIHLLPNGD